MTLPPPSSFASPQHQGADDQAPDASQLPADAREHAPAGTAAAAQGAAAGQGPSLPAAAPGASQEHAEAATRASRDARPGSQGEAAAQASPAEVAKASMEAHRGSVSAAAGAQGAESSGAGPAAGPKQGTGISDPAERSAIQEGWAATQQWAEQVSLAPSPAGLGFQTVGRMQLDRALLWPGILGAWLPQVQGRVCKSGQREDVMGLPGAQHMH